ncbi:MAG: hypothetical protein H6708_24470 [Kofleriaceae bacterium]|nr:hypothetical protein [Kofleriaceae bacterium]
MTDFEDGFAEGFASAVVSPIVAPVTCALDGPACQRGIEKTAVGVYNWTEQIKTDPIGAAGKVKITVCGDIGGGSCARGAGRLAGGAAGSAATAVVLGGVGTLAESGAGEAATVGDVTAVASKTVPDDAIIVLGSNNKPGNFILRPGIDDRAIGGVTAPGKSATIATDLTLETEIRVMFGRAPTRGDTLSAAFVADVRAAGFDVVYAPTEANPLHVRIIAGKRGFDLTGREWLSAAIDRIARARK